jgi:hypothetical protein
MRMTSASDSVVDALMQRLSDAEVEHHRLP